MTERMQQLDALRRAVSRELAIGTLAETRLEVVDDAGEFPVIVALNDERLEVVLRRVRGIGGYANLFVADASRIRVVAIMNAARALDADGAEDMTGEFAPSPDVTIGMFLSYLERRPAGIRLPVSLAPGSAAAPVARVSDVPSLAR